MIFRAGWRVGRIDAMISEMEPVTPILQVATLAAALAAAVTSLRRASGSRLDQAYAFFGAAVAAAMIDRLLSGVAGLAAPVLAVAGSAVCVASWLLARSLFRPEPAFGRAHLAAVGAILAVMGVYQGVVLAAGPSERVTLLAGNLHSLATSAILVLAFSEGVRGWTRELAPAETRLRAAFCVFYAAGLGVAVWWMAQPLDGPDGPAESAAKTVATAAALGLAAVAVGYRRSAPLASRRAAPPRARAASEEDRRLADRIETLVRGDALYLQPGLKVADLAARLHAPEHQVSRAVTAALGAPNFNRYVNALRIEHAKQLLRDEPGLSVLNVALDSGFASIGPFNRAFRELTGLSPREFRGAAGDQAGHARRV